MAERAAHLTGTSFAKPSIFEIVAQESLASTLEPAIRRIITFVASVNPEKYGFLHRSSDEIYLLFNTILQNYYLKHYSASFAETFYGLQRIALKDSKVKLNISTKQKTLSLILLVIFPYLNKKLEDYERKVASTHVNSKWNWQRFLQTFVIRSHKLICAVKEAALLYQYLLYLSGRSKYPTIGLRLLSISLTYAKNQEATTVSDLIEKVKRGAFGIDDGLEALRLSAIRSIEIGAFFLQFLRWWNIEHHDLSLTALPIPPPPQVPEAAKRYKGICPICLKPFRIHMALGVTGLVYCYQCILPELQKHKKCPVTGLPAKEDDLIRLYLQ